MAELILTNGDSAADLLRLAGRAGIILPWRDVLHEGPIVGGALEASSAKRGAYLAQRFGIDADDIAAEFSKRDATVRAHASFDRIELWFEHDLYDQLQLVQILSFLADEQRSNGVTLVQADDFLSAQCADTILRFADRSRPIAVADPDVARDKWSALAASTPEGVAALAATLDGRLPHLKAALHWFLEELPAPGSGLSRTEQAILNGIAAGTTSPMRLFPEASPGGSRVHGRLELLSYS